RVAPEDLRVHGLGPAHGHDRARPARRDRARGAGRPPFSRRRRGGPRPRDRAAGRRRRPARAAGGAGAHAGRRELLVGAPLRAARRCAAEDRLVRVLLVTEVYPPRAGGAGWSTRALALGLRAAVTVRDRWPVCFWSTRISQGALCPRCGTVPMTRCVQGRVPGPGPVPWAAIPYMKADLLEKRAALRRAGATLAVSRAIAAELTEAGLARVEG